MDQVSTRHTRQHPSSSAAAQPSAYTSSSATFSWPPAPGKPPPSSTISSVTTSQALTPFDAICARWWFQSLIFTGIWVIGHEVRLDPIFVFPLLACLPFAKLTSDPQTHQCGHGSFSDYKLLNDAVGSVTQTLLWTPYFSWKISHHRHPSNHASMERDEVYVPKTRADLGLPPADEARPVDYDEILGDTPLYTPFVLVRQQLVAFPAYLLFNVSGQKTYPEATNHFDPKSTLFTPEQRTVVLSSNAGIGAKVIAAISASHVYSLAAVVKYYDIPRLLVTHWFIMITYLHHITPELPHYRGREWNFQRGVAAVDRPFLG
ncbi:hypothetical protein K525DRAFT_268747 [Schizophyllum commune Loenen D]|nr:hypothetical protein K525DRAFT_268747 [Schizophyllum commune Loenen D]